MLLYLVRHAKTRSNRKVIYAGRTNEPIGENTGAAVNRLTDFLLTCNIQHIYSSPLLRTRQTAEPLSDRSGLPITVVPELTEMDVGPWSGLTGAEISTKFPKQWIIWRERPFDMSLQGFENLHEVQARAFAWLCSLSSSAPPAVAFTHEALIKVILCALSKDGESYYRKAVVGNCSVHLIESGLIGERIEWTLRSENLFVEA